MRGKSNYFCIVCRNNNIVDDASSRASKTFYKIPTSPRRRETWLKSLNLEDAKITSRSKVCELHFSKSQCSSTWIKKDAVPSLTARPRFGGNSSVGVGAGKPIRPSKSLAPLFLLTPVTPVPVLQLAPGQSTSATPLIPPTLISSPATPRAVPSTSTPGTSSGGKTAARAHPSTNEGPDTIPLPLRKLLQESLKKEVADKVLRDAPSARSFCEKILTEVESWIKSQKVQKRPEKPVRAGINEVDGEEDESVFLHPAKVECKDDPLGGDGDERDDDNLSDSRAQEFLKMEWHDESAEAEESNEVCTKESDTDEENESVLGL